MRRNLISVYMEGQLKDALKDLEMPESYYDKAITAYESVASSLTSESSVLYPCDPEVILQGSIKIGTAIKPITEDGSYDVDMVCNLSSLRKTDISQQQLKELVGKEIRVYAKKHRMDKDPHDGKRCWTLEYVDEANFHIDILPTVDDTPAHRTALTLGGFSNPEDSEYLAHTDKRHPEYSRICGDWPSTNPAGFAKWFLEAAKYDEHRSRVAFERAASVDEIKVYAVKAPLQKYVQILKRHRDVYIDASGVGAPIRSIVITTAAGKAYEKIQDHADWYGDFVLMVENMVSQIERVGDSFCLRNPSNPLENFTEDWGPNDMENFMRWQKAALSELTIASGIGKKRLLNRYAKKELRRSLGLPEKRNEATRGLARTRLEGLSHHRQHGLTEIDAIEVRITAEKQRNGGLYTPFDSGDPLPKGIQLRFAAHAADIKAFTVRWQVTNDGSEAYKANCLRGDFYQGITLPNGRRARTETTRYVGKHYVECLLERDGVIYGRSEPFVVNIVGGSSAHSSW